MALVYTIYTYGYNHRQFGCWCGPFANWIPQDGQTHYAESRKYESFIAYQCQYLTCVETETPHELLKTTGMNYAIHRLVQLAYGVCELLLLIAFFVLLWRDWRVKG